VQQLQPLAGYIINRMVTRDTTTRKNHCCTNRSSWKLYIQQFSSEL